MADDLGYGDLACYGAPDIRTPHLDRLTRQGVRLTDFYANGPTCSPTRYAFMTGRYQQRGGLEYALFYQQKGAGLPPGADTLATQMRKAGYATALIGKWHLGYDEGRTPNRLGFEYFFGLLGGNHHYFTHVDRSGVPDLFLNERPVERKGVYSTDLFTDDALRYLRETRDRPFFLFLSYNAPHFPYQGPGDAARVVMPKEKSWGEGTRANYVSMVERLDEGIGRVLAELDRRGLADHTLVVFTSDNGGDPKGRNLPLRDLKGSVWEGGIRVPCIVRFPGNVPAGVVSSQVGITMDWTATLLELAGAPKPALDGIDLLPLLAGKRAPQERTLFWRRVPEPVRAGVKPMRAMRAGRWKFVDQPGGARHLFDLSADPAESKDLAAAHPERCAAFERQLDAWEAGFPASNPPAAQARRAGASSK